MTLREQLLERERQWQLYHAYGEEPLLPVRDPRDVLADLSFLLQYYSAEDLAYDPDPENTGIASMRAALAKLSQK